MKKEINQYTQLIEQVGSILEEGRKKAYFSVNTILLETYWQIGKQIIEYEQKGEERAKYGDKILDKISKDLKEKYGKGFGKSNLYYMRLLYLRNPNFQTLSGKLSFSHYAELLDIEDNFERSFYEKQCEKERWSIRELRRQINSGLFYRLALNKDKKKILDLAKNGQEITNAEDIIKEPYILEFLKLPEKHTEEDLEQKIIDNLQMFILELGKGFLFVARQYRISLGSKHFYIDLVFYHKILRCYVLIDLKIGEASHQDIGQMNLYLNYFKKEETEENEPIGIVLAAKKNEIEIEYALGGITNQLFISKYKTYLPEKKQLENQIKEAMR